MNEELFGKLHEEEQYGLFGIEHNKQCFLQSVVCSCYLCGAPIPDKKDHYEMYGEKVCKSCCDEQSDLMLRMSGHEY